MSHAECPQCPKRSVPSVPRRNYATRSFVLERVKNWGCRKVEGSNKSFARRGRNSKFWPAWLGKVQLLSVTFESRVKISKE